MNFKHSIEQLILADLFNPGLFLLRGLMPRSWDLNFLKLIKIELRISDALLIHDLSDILGVVLLTEIHVVYGQDDVPITDVYQNVFMFRTDLCQSAFQDRRPKTCRRFYRKRKLTTVSILHQ